MIYVWLRGFFPWMPAAFVYQFGARPLSLYPTTIILYQANKNYLKSSQTVYQAMLLLLRRNTNNPNLPSEFKHASAEKKLKELFASSF